MMPVWLSELESFGGPDGALNWNSVGARIGVQIAVDVGSESEPNWDRIGV